jgi:hypothetical protein
LTLARLSAYWKGEGKETFPKAKLRLIVFQRVAIPFVDIWDDVACGDCQR